MTAREMVAISLIFGIGLIAATWPVIQALLTNSLADSDGDER